MRPRVVLCGSYNRDRAGLTRLFRELEVTGCRILSPLSVAFESPDSSFARVQSEVRATTKEIESMHLRAIAEADFIFLHAPEGYVGMSAAYELGFAEALSKPVYCKEILGERILQERIYIVKSVFEALEHLEHNHSA